MVPVDRPTEMRAEPVIPGAGIRQSTQLLTGAFTFWRSGPRGASEYRRHRQGNPHEANRSIQKPFWGS